MAGGETTRPNEGVAFTSRPTTPNDTDSIAAAAPPSHLIPSFVELKKVHGTLMRAYLGAINLSSFLPLLFITKRWWARNRVSAYGEVPYLKEYLDHGEGSLIKPPWLAMGFVAKLYVEAHIRGKLKELTAAYTQVEQALDLDADEDYRKWLREARESMSTFSASLGHFQRLRIGVGAFWPAATALVTALGFELSPQQWVDSTVALIVVLVVIVDLGPYLYLVLRSSFLVKRDLFLPGTRVIEKKEEADQRAVRDHAYEAETKVFKVLHRAKPREAAVDLIGSSVVLGVGITVVIVGLARLLNLGDDPVALLGIVGLFGVIIYYVSRIVRRVWR